MGDIRHYSVLLIFPSKAGLILMENLRSKQLQHGFMQ